MYYNMSSHTMLPKSFLRPSVLSSLLDDIEPAIPYPHYTDKQPVLLSPDTGGSRGALFCLYGYSRSSTLVSCPSVIFLRAETAAVLLFGLPGAAEDIQKLLTTIEGASENAQVRD